MTSRIEIKEWVAGMDTEGEHVGEFTAKIVFSTHADCVAFMRLFLTPPGVPLKAPAE